MFFFWNPNVYEKKNINTSKISVVSNEKLSVYRSSCWPKVAAYLVAFFYFFLCICIRIGIRRLISSCFHCTTVRDYFMFKEPDATWNMLWWFGKRTFSVHKKLIKPSTAAKHTRKQITYMCLISFLKLQIDLTTVHICRLVQGLNNNHHNEM